jgi:hypothetical protein
MSLSMAMNMNIYIHVFQYNLSDDEKKNVEISQFSCMLTHELKHGLGKKYIYFKGIKMCMTASDSTLVHFYYYYYNIVLRRKIYFSQR